jgi:hypothetical protein
LGRLSLCFKQRFLKNLTTRGGRNWQHSLPLRPPGHFYSPIADLDAVRRDEARIFELERRPLPGIELHERDQVALLQALLKYYPEMPFDDLPRGNLRYGFVNPAYSYSDGIFLYSMVRHFRPKRIIEVGSGYSSCLMLDVNDLFFDGKIKCEFIDPYPQLLLSLLKEGDAERITQTPRRLQDISGKIRRPWRERYLIHRFNSCCQSRQRRQLPIFRGLAQSQPRGFDPHS